MAERILDKTEIDALLNIKRNQDLKSSSTVQPAFNVSQYQQVADAVQIKRSPFFIDDREYKLHFYDFKGDELVAVHPSFGHIPMGNYHVSKFTAVEEL